MSQARQTLGVLVLAILAMFAGYGVAAAQTPSTVGLLGFDVTFDGAEYDAVKDETTFTYTVRGTPLAPHDLSHFNVALCVPKTLVVRAGIGSNQHYPGSTKIEIGFDPTTQLTGIKFDVETSKTGEKVLWFVLKGNWAVGSVDISGKAGQNTQTVPLVGPVCDSNACQVNYTVISNRTDFRILRPGTYASVLAQLQLSGNSGVVLTFNEFGDATYLENPGAPAARLEFSVGESLADADAYGWFTPETFNGTQYPVERGLVEAGVEVTIWSRMTVDDFNSSSDYRATGKVSITLDCM